MIAIDHPSAAMRSQAVLSLATIVNTATTTSDNTDIVAMNGSDTVTSVTPSAVHGMMSDVSSALLRRISDTDASVVTAVCSCSTLLHELARYCNNCSNSSSTASDETAVTTDTLVQTVVQALYHWLSQLWHQRSQVTLQASSSAVISLLKLLSLVLPQGRFQGDGNALLSLIVLPALLECMPSKYAAVKCSSGITDSSSNDVLAVKWCAINCEAVKVAVRLHARLSIKLCSALNNTIIGQCTKLQQQLTVRGKKSETVNSETVQSVTDSMLEVTSEALAQGVVEIMQQKLSRKAAARYNISGETVYCVMLQALIQACSVNGKSCLLQATTVAVGHMISHTDASADTKSEDNSATAVNTLSSSVAAVVIQELKRTTLAQTHSTSNSGVVTTTSSSYHADQYLSVHELLPHLTTVTAHLTTSSSTTTSLQYSDYITVHGTVTSDMMTAQASDVLQYLLTLAVAAQHNASALKHSTTADDHSVDETATTPVVTLVQTAIYDVLKQHYSMRPIPVLIALASGSHLTSTTTATTTSTDIDSSIDSSISAAPIVAASALTTAVTYIQAVAAACNAGNSSSSSSALHETAVTVQTLLTDVTAALPILLTLLGSSYKAVREGALTFLKALVQHGEVLLSAVTASTDSVTKSTSKKTPKKSRKSSVTTIDSSELTFKSDVTAVYPSSTDQQPAALATPTFTNLLLLCKFLSSNACSDIVLDDTCIERCMTAVLMQDNNSSNNDDISGSAMTNGHSDNTVYDNEVVVLDSALIETAAAMVSQQDTRVSLSHYILSHAQILGYSNQYIASLLYGYTDSVTLSVKWQYVHALLVYTMHVAATQTTISRDTVLLLHTLLSCYSAAMTQSVISDEQRDSMFDTVITALSSSSSAVLNEAMHAVICTTGWCNSSITPQQRARLLVSLLCILHTTGSSGSIVQALKAIAATIPSQVVMDILQSLLNKLDTTSSHSTAVTSKASKSKSKAASKKAISKTNDSSSNDELADILLQATASDAITAITLIAEYIQLVTQQQQQQEQSKKHNSKTSKANSNSSVSHTAAVSIDWLLANALFTALHSVSSQQLSTAVHSKESSDSNSSNAMVVVTSADANNTNTAVLPVAVDYCIRALFDALTAIITSTTAAVATITSSTTDATVTATAAAENTRTLVTVLQSGVTTQTRNAGLLLLASITEALPDDTVHDSIHSILQLLSQGVAISDDTYSFKLTQQMIERVLPIIHSTRSSSDNSNGIRVLDVVNTFVTSLLSVTSDNVTAQGKRLALVFTSLLTALSNSALASIGLSLLSHAALQAISSSSSSHSSSSIVSTQQQQQQQLSANAIVNFAHAVCLKCSVSNQIKVLTDMIKATHRLAFEVVDTSTSLALQQTKQALGDEGSGSHLQFMTSTSSNSNSSSSSGDSFMVLDMNTLLSSSTGIDTAKHARVLMHKQLQFIKEHLAAKALHLQIASDIAAAKRSANTKQHDTATVAVAALQSQLQEDFLLLCEELLLLLRTLATCHITDSNSNSTSSHTDTKHNWSAMQKLGHEKYQKLAVFAPACCCISALARLPYTYWRRAIALHV
eukprot:17060-Heterococcus_DN1.PRE.4